MIDVIIENVFVIKSIVAVISGTTLQYLFGEKRGIKVFLFLLLSSAFFAVYVVLPIIEFMELGDSPSQQAPFLALSALISVELISIVIKFLPSVAKKRLTIFLESLHNDKK